MTTYYLYRTCNYSYNDYKIMHSEIEIFEVNTNHNLLLDAWRLQGEVINATNKYVYTNSKLTAKPSKTKLKVHLYKVTTDLDTAFKDKVNSLNFSLGTATTAYNHIKSRLDTSINNTTKTLSSVQLEFPELFL